MVCYNFTPQKWFIYLLGLIYSFYDFKEYMLRVISFKDIYQYSWMKFIKNYQIFLNGYFLLLTGKIN
jgi:hypothetical protein